MTTGNKDTDYIVLSKLDDRSLFSYCRTDKYAYKICSNEQFWKDRFVSKIANKGSPNLEYFINLKPKGKTWKKFYLQIVSIMNIDLDEVELLSESEYIDFLTKIFKNSLGEWDIFDLFEKLFPKRNNLLFLADKISRELRTIVKNMPTVYAPLIELFNQDLSSFKILKIILKSSNESDLIEKVKKGIINYNELSKLHKEYLDKPLVKNYVDNVEQLINV